MPRKSKKNKRTCEREKPSSRVSQSPQVLGVHTKETQEDERAWDEKDEDELEFPGYIEETEDNSKALKRNSSEKKESLEVTEGIDYPLDIWFLISEKVKPEDVGRFAAICQATYYIVSTAKFWFSLYRRNYCWTEKLPERLAFHFMDNIRGLKAAVIRSLFYMYSPFCARVSKEEPLSGHPATLVGAQCLSHWHIKVGNFHKYYFMFAKHIKKKQPKYDRRCVTTVSSDSLVHVNPDEGCCILETISNEMCRIPLVMGNHLFSGQLGLAAGLCNHRLQLTLGPAYLLPRNNSGIRNRYQISTTEMCHVTIEPVRDVKIYPWWHPHYGKCLPHYEEIVDK